MPTIEELEKELADAKAKLAEKDDIIKALRTRMVKISLLVQETADEWEENDEKARQLSDYINK